MKAWIFLLAMTIGAVAVRAAELLPIEKQVGEAIQSPTTTVVHFWAPWCANCYQELTSPKGNWAQFIHANPDVKFIFITSWNAGLGDGRDVLKKAGLDAQKNFQVLLHPNGARRDEERMKSFLGYPVNWIPATWVFRKGKQLYALNYGELRFPILQQLVKDASENWDR